MLEEYKNLWLTSIHRRYPKFKVYAHSLVCSKHFLSTDFIVSARSKSRSLKKGSVPTIFDTENTVYVFNDCKLVNKSTNDHYTTFIIIIIS